MIPYDLDRRAKLVPVATLGATAVAGALLAIPAPAAAEVPYQDFKDNSCAHALCEINFAPPPAGKRLAITSESCSYTTNGSSKIVNAEIDLVDSNNQLNGLREFLVPTLLAAGTTLGNVYAANHTTLIYVPPNFHLQGRVSVTVSNGETIACKITGTVETP